MIFDPFRATDEEHIVFRDVITLALAGFIAMLILVIPHLNPPTKPKDDAPPPGDIVVELRWQDGAKADVDLWTRAPGDVPVGYSNSHGQVFDLLRDDLGGAEELGGLNMETAYTRGTPDGEYIINAHLFSDREGRAPLPVHVVVRLRAPGSRLAVQVYAGTVTLRHVGEERTVVRFTLKDGALVPGSVHDLPRPLRSAA